MQCPICGYAQPGPAARCPECGRVFAKAEAPAAPAAKESWLGFCVYTALLFGGGWGLLSFGSKWVDAEQERIEAALLGQGMEHKRQIRELEE